MTIYDEYGKIYQIIQKLGYLLIKKLNKCEVEKSNNLSFDQLITAIEEIKTKPYINNNNIKPTNKPELITDKSLADFNKSLAKRIAYYKKLISYYLVLKGIPTYEVNACNTLAELINLIDKIEITKKSYLTIDIEEINESFGYAIPVPYTLKDKDGNDITEGRLTLTYGGSVYFFTAGDKITFTPLHTDESGVLKLEYHGSDNYYQHDPVYVNVTITPSKIKLNVDIENINYSSRYANSHDTGYIDDTWQFTIETFNYKGIPLSNIDIELQNGCINRTFKTDDNGKYTFTSKIGDTGQCPLKFITNANSTEYTNVEIEYNIFIKYNMLSTSTNITNYAGKTYTYDLEIHNEDTNQIDTSYDGQRVNIVYENGDIITETIQNGKISHSRTSLIAGEYSIGWIFYGEDFETSTKTNIHILSNFTLPNEDAFFLNTTPTIKYHPLGNITANKEVEVSVKGLVTVSVEAYDENNNQIFKEDDDGNLIPVYTNEIQEQAIIPEGTIFKTDSNGVLTDFTTILDAGQYKVTLKSHGDDLNEIISYAYELKKPFTIELSDYDKKDHAEFKLIIYDLNNSINYSATNGTNNIWDIRVEEEDTPANINEYISKIIRWNAMSSTIGTNTLTIEQNGYIETLNFKLYDRLFSFSEGGVLSTQITRTVGVANIQIVCIDESVDSISIEGTEVLSIEKINDLFNVEIINRSTGLKTLLITDDSGAQESLTINVIKDNLADSVNASIVSYANFDPENPVYEETSEILEVNVSELNQLLLSFTIDKEIYSDLDTIYYKITNNNNIIDYCTFKYSTENEIQTSLNESSLSIPTTLLPDEACKFTFIFYGNDNYESFTKEIILKISQDEQIPLTIDTYVGYDSANYGSLTFTEIPSTASINQDCTIAVQLLDYIKQPISGETVKFWINEEIYTAKKTDASGMCSVIYLFRDTNPIYVRASASNCVSNQSIIQNVK